jgi:hypothetical protein
MMSKFTFTCEDEAIPFGGVSKTTHEFETDELYAILTNFTLFLRGCNFIDGDKVISISREVDLSDE